MLVARNIEAIMARKGTNAAEVARRMGPNPTVVYDILSGKSKSPRLDTLHKIASIGLGVPISALLREASEEELDQELVEVISMLPAHERRRFLTIARAWTSDAASA